MTTTVYKVSSLLFPTDTPSCWYYVHTNKRAGGYGACLSCIHFDRWGRLVKVVRIYDAGTWPTRWRARRRAENRLEYYLAGYPFDSIIQAREKV